MIFKLKLAVVALLALFVFAGPTVADCPSPYFGGYFGYHLFPSIYSLDYIPYYAQFPPVYYSYPIPRPYGWSPYAYPPGTRTPAGPEPRPVTMRNPYVPQQEASEQPTARVAVVTPLRQRNPYVVVPESEAGQAVAAAGGR
ncbi:MAG TPA: hypothetical protein EYH34_02015 [Planctomycetes bacterium]|nr:hypothetical protein [Planctomycetota bacterium]